MHTSNSPASLILPIWIGYVFFVIYGSLVPLDFKALPLEQAWAIFQTIPMYTLGVESRADWISNGVLYVPVGALTAHLLTQWASGVHRIPLVFIAGVFSFALAFGIEFTQIFFPPRTVSLNDILAECIGSVVGLILAAKFSEWLKGLLLGVVNTPQKMASRLLEAYLAAYLAYSLFPYDILLSGAELDQKLQSDSWGWLLAGDPHGNILIALKSLSEIVLTIPFGLFLAYRSRRQPASYGQAISWGLLLGVFIEIAQLYTATGVSQGLSVLTRVAGVGGGLALWSHRTKWSPERLAALAHRYAPVLGVIYLLALLQVNGWFTHRWNGVDFAVTKLSELHYLPFYYHYYTTEAKALFSLAAVCLMYFPLGLLTWSSRGSPTQAFLYALFGAGVVETGKLFLQGMHPDPTNIMLGALASWGFVHLARVLSNAASAPSMPQLTVSNGSSSAPHDKRFTATAEPTRRWATYGVMAPSLAFAAYWAATFPTQPVFLCVFLAACAALIGYHPALIALFIPAALPVLDFAPWSGRYFFDEFDLLLLTCLAVGYARGPRGPRLKSHRDALFTAASALLAVSFAISAVRGLIPWPPHDANAFANYHSSFNALRIGKGALWAFLTYGLLRRLAAAEIDIRRPLALGMTTGLALTVAVIFWERLTFVGLSDFSSDYRVTGLFSSMHTGGAYIECFLVTTLPFLLLLVFQSRSWGSRLLGGLLLLASTYALMVTFSRNGYSAFGAAVAISLFFTLFRSGRRQQRSILIVLLVGAMSGVALPIFMGQFAQERISTLAKDYATRQAHWQDALDIRTPDWPTTLFGMGLGRYPESHYLLSNEARHAGTFRLKSEDGNPFLRLGSGDPIYFEQIVSIVPRRNYVLKLDVRASQPNEKIAASVCEKWLLASFSCVSIALNAGPEAGAWSTVEASFSSASLGDHPWYASKPVKFALHNPSGKSRVDIDNVKLETISGESLLLNGDFSKALDHWYFSADGHLQWHTKSLLVSVLFDQGWFGLITLCLFLMLAIRRAAGRAWRGDLHAAAALASLCGFLVVGLFDTLIDAPRFLLLLLLLCWYCRFTCFSAIEDKENG